MRYLTFGEKPSNKFDIAILVPTLNKNNIEKYYIEPTLSKAKHRIIAYDLHKTGKRTPVKTQKEYLDELIPVLEKLSVKMLIVCDAEYFKTLTRAKNAVSSYGYVLDSVIGNFKVMYCPNYEQVFYDPQKVISKIELTFRTLDTYIKGSYQNPGEEIIHYESYPNTYLEIEAWLERLLDMDCDLTCDIETFDLKHHKAGIGTISFAWNKHEGIAFPVDYISNLDEDNGFYGFQSYNSEVRELLRNFFIKHTKKIKWHNITFDVYVLIFQLFMDDILDQEGLLTGLDIMLKNWDCTKLISYLATNSCAGNKLSLKEQAQEFAGNYAVDDIKDIRKIPIKKLLRYNLVDCLSTWHVDEKNTPIMLKDNQEDFYITIFKRAVKDIIQMQLTGLPVNMKTVKLKEKKLNIDRDDALKRLNSSSVVKGFIHHLNVKYVNKRNAKLKNKVVLITDSEVNESFNPNSPPQLQELLYGEEFMNLPVIDFTDKKAPATGNKTLKKLINHTDNKNYIAFIEALIDFKDVDKILSTFIPALLNAALGSDGWHYLFGNFNLGGTKSGRLSSSNPNLQNLPSSSRYAKDIKECIEAPPGWLFIGLDYNSLEDMISALTTKDPMKLKVYTDGYDGHCLRAYYYFTEKMPDIDPLSVKSINSIKKKYPSYRQISKNPTFALTYQGTWVTLMNNCGFTEDLAKSIEANYHELYTVSDEYIAEKLEKATKTGYVEIAFGLRLRTPLLHQVILGNSKTPYEAAAEGRTAGNAMGQSWCLLNSRSASVFMDEVRDSVHKLVIKPCAQIHDAQYYLVPKDLNILDYTNKRLVDAVKWQEHPDIKHPDVKLGGELSLFYPTWANEIVIPNIITKKDMKDLINENCKQK